MIHDNYYNYNNRMPNNMFYGAAPAYQNITQHATANTEKHLNENVNDNEKCVEDNVKIFNGQNAFESMFNNKSQIRENQVKKSREFFTYDKDSLSLFGFSFDIDDLLIIGILIFLFLENKRDYLLLIVLGLMLFDISIDTFKNMNIVKQLFNPS